MKARLRDRDRDVVDAVFDLAPVSVVLAFDSSGVVAALGRAGLINASDRIGTGVLASNDRLTPVTEFLFVPDDGFKKTLLGPRRNALLQGDRFGVLWLHVREQSSHINEQQSAAFDACEAVLKKGEKLTEQFAQLCNILDRHGTAFRGFVVKQSTHGGSSLFHIAVNVTKLQPEKNLQQAHRPNPALSS